MRRTKNNKKKKSRNKDGQTCKKNITRSNKQKTEKQRKNVCFDEDTSDDGDPILVSDE